jgi:large subunit ribosomal protein L7/L12
MEARQSMADITIDQILGAIEKMTIIEVNELVQKIEEKFDVSAAMPMAAVPAAAAAEEAVEEQTEFTVVLKEYKKEDKIKVIKEVRAITSLGLKEAKELVEGVPKDVITDVPKEEAEKVKKQLEDAGGVVEVK